MTIFTLWNQGKRVRLWWLVKSWQTMSLRSLREITSIALLCQKNLIIRRKSWRNQQPMKVDSPYQPHHPLTLYPGITGRTSKSENFKISTTFINHLKINFHHHQIIHILYMYSHAHGFVYPYHTSIWESNWIQEQIINQIIIISHFKRTSKLCISTSWQTSWSNKLLG